MDTADLHHSPLEAEHLAEGGRLVPFAGWSLPVQYEGILAEHRAVRSAVGVFDISHMGQFTADGPGVAPWLEHLVTARVSDLAVGQGRYALLLNEHGGVIDDLILYRTGVERFFLVVNASRRAEDFAWMTARLADGVTLRDRSPHHGALAVQGPDSARVHATMMPEGPALPERFGVAEADGGLFLCRTGYTGEDGFELCAPADSLRDWWQKAVAAGAKPCGLGARDLLRLEKCYPLNGNDLSPEHTPLEAGLGFAVDLSKPDFIGADALRRQRAGGIPRRLVAIALSGKAPPPRPGYPVHSAASGGEILGTLTSGGFSPLRNTGIALAYVPDGSHRPGTSLWIGIRDKRFPAVIVSKPFV